MSGQGDGGRVRLPRTRHIDELRAAVDAGLRVLALDLGRWLGAACQQRGIRLDSAWAALSERGRFRFSLSDPADLLALLSKPVPELAALGIPLHLRQQLYEAKRVRNELYHHVRGDLDVDDAALWLQPLQRVAAALNLPAHEEITALRSAVLSLGSDGAIVREADADELARQLREVREELARHAAEEASLLEHRDELEAGLEEAQQRLMELQAAEEEASRDLADARAEAERVDELRMQLDALEATHRERAESVEAALAVEHLRRIRLQRVLDAESPVQDVRDEPEPVPRQADSDELVPGQSWHYPRGDLVLRLSPRHRDLLLDDGRSLRACGSAEAVDEAVEAFLRVRPEGGRVWVDDDGDASTFVDGELVYLGRLPAHALVVAPATRPPRPQPQASPPAAGLGLSIEAVLAEMRMGHRP